VVLAQELTHPNDDASQRLVNDLNSALANVFADHGVDPSSINIFDGDVFSSFRNNCPACGNRLNVEQINQLNPWFACARASCPGGWSGRLIYRPIDYDQTLDANVSEDTTYEGSCVTRYNNSPTYTAHRGVNKYEF
jgi:hypothetical protein